ncbi:MAG: hypothetical protein AB7E52_01125 [Bdellovibrionales bacterium]
MTLNITHSSPNAHRGQSFYREIRPERSKALRSGQVLSPALMDAFFPLPRALPIAFSGVERPHTRLAARQRASYQHTPLWMMRAFSPNPLSMESFGRYYERRVPPPDPEFNRYDAGVDMGGPAAAKVTLGATEEEDAPSPTTGKKKGSSDKSGASKMGAAMQEAVTILLSPAEICQFVGFFPKEGASQDMITRAMAHKRKQQPYAGAPVI